MAISDNNVCGKCGYDLTGIAMRGRCPECGNMYDRRRGLGIKLMPTAEQRGDQLMKLIRTIALTLATLVVIALTSVLYALGFAKVLGIGLVTIVILGLAAVTSYISYREGL